MRWQRCSSSPDALAELGYFDYVLHLQCPRAILETVPSCSAARAEANSGTVGVTANLLTGNICNDSFSTYLLIYTGYVSSVQDDQPIRVASKR